MARRRTGHGDLEQGLAWDGIDLQGMAERFINDLDKDLGPVMRAVGAAAKANARQEALNEFPTSKVYAESFQVEVQRPGRRGQFSIVLWNTHRAAHILEDGQKANYYPIPRGGARIWYSNDYREFGRMNGHHVLRIATETAAAEWGLLPEAKLMPRGQRSTKSGSKFRAPEGRFSGQRRSAPPIRKKAPKPRFSR